MQPQNSYLLFSSHDKTIIIDKRNKAREPPVTKNQSQYMYTKATALKSRDASEEN
jgi:hypothetical protein